MNYSKAEKPELSQVSYFTLNRQLHLEATLIPPITQARRIPLSSHDSEFMSTMPPTLPNRAVQSRNCRKTCGMQTGGWRVSRVHVFLISDVCVCVSTAHPVSIDDPQAARVGANPLLFDVVEHVNEQGTVDLVGQVNGRVTLKRSKVYVRLRLLVNTPEQV